MIKGLVVRPNSRQLNNYFTQLIAEYKAKGIKLKLRKWVNFSLEFENGDQYEGFIITNDQDICRIMAISRDYNFVNADSMGHNQQYDWYVYIRPTAYGNRDLHRKYCAEFSKAWRIKDD